MLEPFNGIQSKIMSDQCAINYRRYLWGMGLGVAKAMDTAQRGMGLN